MSEKIAKLQNSSSFEERMDILTQELELAIRWRRPAIIMVAYGSAFVRDDSISVIENFLFDHYQKIVRISAGDSTVNFLGFWLKILEDTDDIVFFLEGFSELEFQHNFLDILNQYAYMFAEKKARFVLWLTFKEASTISYHAPEFWARRQRLIELTASPKPEQILQYALESAWQGTGEYSEQFEDMDAKISLQESFLTELPLNKETTSIRANLLLTLGILHWRKGDYEKASDFLQNALMISAKMQDNWFEAKCFNAIALVKTSLGRNEEAIDSYKQAIKLAPDQLFVWNNLGNLCLQIGRNHEAMIAFEKAINHNSSDPIAWNGMGKVYAQSEYTDDAIAAYRKSIELAPLLPNPWNGLGEVYAHCGRPTDAVLAFQEAIKLNSRFILPWLGLARLYSRQKDHREAAKAYQQALMIDPRDSRVWNDLGCVYIEAKKYDEAVNATAKAIELDRSFGWAYSNLGLAHASNEKVEESIPFYLKSLDLLQDEKQRNLTWNRLADSYRLMNDYENAIRAYQKADSSKTGIPPLDNNGVDAPQLDSISDVNTATETDTNIPEQIIEESSVENLVTQAEIDPEAETPYWVFQSTNQRDDVTTHLFQKPSHLFGSKLDTSIVHPATSTQEIGDPSMQMILPFISNKEVSRQITSPKVDASLTPDAKASHARIWNEKGNILLREGSFEDAIAAYNKAIKYDRSFGWSYTNLGIAYLQLGKYAEAVLLLQKSLELLKTDKERAVAWNELGNLYRCLNDYHNAVVSYQKADELNPDHDGESDTVEYLHTESTVGNVQIWYELGDSFLKAGSYDEATSCYRKVTEMAPNNGWAFKLLAMSLTYQSKYEEAVPAYLASVDLLTDDKEKADSWNRLGNVYRRLNDYSSAVNAYKNAVKLNKETATLLTRTRFSLLGNCYVE